MSSPKANTSASPAQGSSTPGRGTTPAPTKPAPVSPSQSGSSPGRGTTPAPVAGPSISHTQAKPAPVSPAPVSSVPVSSAPVSPAQASSSPGHGTAPAPVYHVQTEATPLIAGGAGTNVEVDVSILPPPCLIARNPAKAKNPQARNPPGCELELARWLHQGLLFGVATQCRFIYIILAIS